MKISTPHSLPIASVTASLAGALLLSSGCPKVCNDDGFAWQQDELCQASATIASTGTETETESDATTTAGTVSVSATETATVTTTMSSASETGGATTQYCKDGDGDGFGDPDQCTDVPMGDDPPSGTVPNADDCDDTNPNTFPGSAPLDDPRACMEDDDDDDHGDANPSGGGGGVIPGSDYCDDNQNAWMESTCMTCADDDGDGYWTGCDLYPNPNSPDPRNPEYGDQYADCDDADDHTFPGSAPLDDPKACMKDADDDDYGDDFGGMMPPPGVVPGTDCDDANDHTFPGSAPLDDPSACMQDEDDDDHGDTKPDKPGVAVGSDCFDNNPILNPSNTRLMTAPTSVTDTANVSEIVAGNGVYDVTPYKTFDVSGFLSWRIESMSVDPVTSRVFGWLDDEGGRGLVEIDYCGGAPPAPPSPKLKNKRVCGISFMADGRLFGVDYSVDQFLEFSADGQEIINLKPLTLDGNLLNIGADCGMTYDCFNDRLLLSDSSTAGIYTLDLVTGAATLLTSPMVEFGGGLALDPVKKELLSCLGTDFTAFSLADFSATALDPLGVASVNDLEYAPLCQ